MSDVDAKSKLEAAIASPAAVWTPEPAPRETPRRRLRILPLLITLVALAVAGALGRAMWNAYMGAPWTRDGTVRVYVVTMAPEVAGRIVGLPVKDNQFVHKGDLLLVKPGEAIAAASPFTSIADLIRRVPGLRKDELRMLAEVGALNSLTGGHRRDALWEAEHAIRPAGPLFEKLESPHGFSPLARMADPERIRADARVQEAYLGVPQGVA